MKAAAAFGHATQCIRRAFDGEAIVLSRACEATASYASDVQLPDSRRRANERPSQRVCDHGDLFKIACAKRRHDLLRRNEPGVSAKAGRFELVY
jgi:hypothetical protein